jgi:hypothetical protein
MGPECEEKVGWMKGRMESINDLENMEYRYKEAGHTR